MIVAVIVLGAMVLVLLALVLRGQKRPADTNSALLLKEDLRALSEDITKLKDGMQTQISERMEKSQALMMGSLQKQSSESNKIITEITRNLTELKESNKRVVDVADELKTLQNVLQNPKQRGGLGEYYLETVLGNVLPPHVYQMQYSFKDGQIVDAIIKLDKGRILPIDSKFSLENYNRLIEEKDKTQRDIIVRTFKTDLKNRIDETAKYIRPSEDTLDYAFMFIPSEAIYYDLLVNNVGATGTNSRDLIEYAFVDKKVIIVSPTTLLAYLQTVMQGLKSLQIEEQAKDIQKRVGELGKHIAAHESFMQKLGNSLGTSIGHYNAAHKSLKSIDKDVIKIADTVPSVEPLLLERPQLDEAE
ncbi:MAG TPA: DNA recombination protein RmuC [Candidatus Saccharimonadales bacterium]|nr:DNA recombination protein RmuC [Candidatus Saccharimonadales bacterium]